MALSLESYEVILKGTKAHNILQNKYKITLYNCHTCIISSPSQKFVYLGKQKGIN